MYSPYEVGAGGGGSGGPQGSPLEPVFNKLANHNFYLIDHVKQLHEVSIITVIP